MDSTKSSLLKNEEYPPPAELPEGGISKNARVEAGRSPSAITGRPAPVVCGDVAVEDGSELDIESGFIKIASEI